MSHIWTDSVFALDAWQGMLTHISQLLSEKNSWKACLPLSCTILQMNRLQSWGSHWAQYVSQRGLIQYHDAYDIIHWLLWYLVTSVIPVTDLDIANILVVSCSEAVIGEVLGKYLDQANTLFIISSDFCHWGSRFGYNPYDPQKVFISPSHQLSISQYSKVQIWGVQSRPVKQHVCHCDCHLDCRILQSLSHTNTLMKPDHGPMKMGSSARKGVGLFQPRVLDKTVSALICD